MSHPQGRGRVKVAPCEGRRVEAILTKTCAIGLKAYVVIEVGDRGHKWILIKSL